MTLGRFGLQAVYTVSELAEMANITRGRMRRMLDSCEVNFIRTGGIDYVGISELQDKCGSLWSSAKLLYHFRQIEHEDRDRIRSRTEEVSSHNVS